uniref:Uncharacterized protein n=1 Tax=Anguilla anguilla TaxID=7936 RepID=A0A0E9R6H7_ANGAN
MKACFCSGFAEFLKNNCHFEPSVGMQYLWQESMHS